MRYFALRIIKWFFYGLAVLQLIGGGLAVIQIANMDTAPAPAIAQPGEAPVNPFAQNLAPGTGQQTTTQKPPSAADALGSAPTAEEAQQALLDLFARSSGWAIIVTIIFTLIMALVTVAIAQMIGVVIDIADNTRRSAIAAEKRA